MSIGDRLADWETIARDWQREAYRHKTRAERAEADLAEARVVIEIIAGKRQCIDNLMSHAEIARAFLERTVTAAETS